MGTHPRPDDPRAHHSGGPHTPRRVLIRRPAELYYRLRSRPPLISRRRPPAPPDFVGIGAQRSGTSWWHSLVETHPDVHALGWPFKELHYFDRFATDAFGDDDVRAYHEVFRRPAGRIAGEWTPRYMYDPTTPALLHRSAPDARLLVMLRDPVARFRSGFAHALARGVARDDARDDAVRRGLYHEQLQRVLAEFPREQLLVLQFEQCVAQPHEQLARTFAFLGLAPFRLSDTVDAPVNRGRAPADVLSDTEQAQLRATYASDARALADLFSEIDLALWPGVS